MTQNQFKQYFFSEACCVFGSDAEPISFTQFWHAVAQCQQYLLQQPQTQFALWTEDSLVFATWLWASQLAAKRLILPPHRIATLEQEFAAQGIAFLPSEINLPPTGSHAASINAADAMVQLPLDWQACLQHKGLVFFTSGSTGTAKQIERSLWQLLSEISTLSQHFAWQSPASFIASVSHQHIYGLLFKILLPLSTGQAFCRQQLNFPEQIEQTLAQQTALGRHSYLIASPALLKRCAASFRFAEATWILSSGGVLEAGVRAHYPSTIIEVLGSSETGGMATRSQDHASWQCLPDVQFRIDAAQQLWVQTAHAYCLEWIATGDLAEADADQFRLLGRGDRLIKLEEKRLSLDQIEQQILQLEAVQACYLLINRDKQREFLSALVVLEPKYQQQLVQEGKLALIKDLKQQLRGRLESIAIPRHWRFVSQIPRDSQGKINKPQMQALFQPRTQPWIYGLQQDDEAVHCQVEFLAELIPFKGHFAGFPVYPGVAQIAFLVQIAQQQWSDFAACQGYEQLKFQQLIRPYDVLRLSLQRQAHKVSFQLYATEASQVVASGRLLFAVEMA